MSAAKRSAADRPRVNRERVKVYRKTLRAIPMPFRVLPPAQLEFPF